MRVRALPHRPGQVEAETLWGLCGGKVVADGVDDLSGLRLVEGRDRGGDQDLAGLAILRRALLAHKGDSRHGGDRALDLADRGIVGRRQRTVGSGGNDDRGGADILTLEWRGQRGRALARTARRKELGVIRLGHAR